MRVGLNGDFDVTRLASAKLYSMTERMHIEDSRRDDIPRRFNRFPGHISYHEPYGWYRQHVRHYLSIIVKLFDNETSTAILLADMSPFTSEQKV